MARESECRLVVRERFAEATASMVHLCDASDGRKVFRRGFEHALELDLRCIELVHFEQRTAERDTRRQVTRVNCEAGAARRDRVLITARATVLFGELRKRNRRRILLDPASKFFYTGIVRHAWYSLKTTYSR